jgi:hypothetical protein
MSEATDIALNLNRLAEVRAELGWVSANAVDAGAWARAWTAMIEAAHAEAVLGTAEGLDQLRSDFLDRVATLALGATQAWQRIANPGRGDLTIWRIVRHHRSGWHALQGLRQGLAWIWTPNGPSGASPALAVTASGQQVLDLLLADPLDVTWTRRDTVNTLNSLAGGLLWRA